MGTSLLRCVEGGRRPVVLRGAALVAAVLLLNACWIQVGFDASLSRNNWIEQGLTISNVGTLRQVWSRAVGAVPGEPIVLGDGRVYLTHSRSSVLTSLDAATGNTVWTRSLSVNGGPSWEDGGRSWPVTAVGGELWASWINSTPGMPAPSCEGGVERIDRSDGSMNGTLSADGPAQVAPFGTKALANQWRIGPACGGSSTLSVFDIGATTPSWESAQPIGGSGGGMPVVIGDRIFVNTTSSGQAHVYDADGCGAPTCLPAAYLQLPNDIDRIYNLAGRGDSLFATVHVNDGTLPGVSQLVAIDPVALEVLWRAPLDDARDGVLAMTADTVYSVGISPDGSTLEAFPSEGCGSSTCSADWSAPLGENGLPPTLAIAGGVLYAGAGNEVLAFNAGGCGTETCAPIVRVAVGAAPRQLVVAVGQLYVTTQGALLAFAPS